MTSSGSNVAQGTVNFEENGTILAGTVSLNSNGQASFTTSTLSEGIHVITALYSGVPGSFNVSSAMVSEEIDNQTVVTGTTYCNPGGITIPSDAATQPYPSRVFVTNLQGTVSKVTVTLDNLAHQFPTDADMLLTGPTGTNLVFWGDAGGSTPVSGLNVTLDDAAGSGIPSPVVSGTFQPTADNGNVIFPSPAPANPSFAAPAGSATLTSSFQNINANGTWSFYIFDANAGSGGAIGQACLSFTENAPVLVISKSHTGTFTQGDAADTYTIQVTNIGPGPTGGEVTVTEVPPTGLTVTGMSGNNWSCSGNTCTRSDALNASNTYDSITVTVSVAANAPSSLTNQATVSGGGSPGTQTANDTTTILQTPASITPSGGSGQSANVNATFTLPLQATVLDGGNNPIQRVTVTFTAPSTGPSGTFPGGFLTATGPTNAAGVATSPAFAANSTAGSYSVAATVPGLAASASFSLTNNGLPQTITFNPIANQVQGTTLNLVASATSGLPVSFASLTTGICTVSGTVATLSNPGTCTIQATQSGNATYAAAQPVSESFTVLTTQTITFNPIANQAQGTTLNLVASATSGLPVSFASLTTGVCTVSGTVATLTNPGTCTIQATQSGNTTYAAAQPVSQSFTVLATQTITFNPIGNQAQGTTLNLVASATSGLPVSFTSLTTGVCTVSGTVATLSNPGTCTIQATQSGNATYAAAQPVSQSFTVLPAANFTITPVPAQETIKRGVLAEFALRIQSVNGFQGYVRLSCAGGPVGSYCADLPRRVYVNGTAHALSGILFPKNTTPGTYTVTFTGVSGSLTNSATAQFTVE